MTVFASLYAGQYDSVYSEKDYIQECDVIEIAINQYGNKPVSSLLDIGCGTGGHALIMAQRGYDVTGVDLSPSMIEIAKEKSLSLKADKRPEWICGDARNFEINKKYDMTVMMFAVVGYLTSNSDVIEGLKNARKHLVDGGLFLCDFWFGPSVMSVRPTERVRVLDIENGKIIRAVSTDLDIAAQTADVSMRLWTIKNGKSVDESTENHKVRYFFPKEFELFLDIAGFELLSISAFPHLDRPLDEKTWNAVIVAKAK